MEKEIIEIRVGLVMYKVNKNFTLENINLLKETLLTIGARGFSQEISNEDGSIEIICSEDNLKLLHSLLFDRGNYCIQVVLTDGRQVFNLYEASESVPQVIKLVADAFLDESIPDVEWSRMNAVSFSQEEIIWNAYTSKEIPKWLLKAFKLGNIERSSNNTHLTIIEEDATDTRVNRGDLIGPFYDFETNRFQGTSAKRVINPTTQYMVEFDDSGCILYAPKWLLDMIETGKFVVAPALRRVIQLKENCSYIAFSEGEVITISDGALFKPKRIAKQRKKQYAE